MALQSAKDNFLRWQELITALFLASLFLLLELELFTQLTAIIVTSVFAAIQLVRAILTWRNSYETKISTVCDVFIAFGALTFAITSNFSMDPTLLTFHIAPYLCFFCAVKAIAAIVNTAIWGYRFHEARNNSYITPNEINDSASALGAEYNAAWYGMVNSICTTLAYLGAFAFTAIIAFTQFGFGGSLPFVSPAYFSFHIGQLFVTPLVMTVACFIPLILFQFYFGLKGDPAQRYERATTYNSIPEQCSVDITPNSSRFEHKKSQLDDTKISAPQTLKEKEGINDWSICPCCSLNKNNSDDK
ncbi:MAG: hypothetical protein M1561_02770 [Gammaproteobacteria bacterium]|nr:hypothetical protein [Gammaproteobacteria bacterium]